MVEIFREFFFSSCMPLSYEWNFILQVVMINFVKRKKSLKLGKFEPESLLHYNLEEFVFPRC